MGKRKRTTHPQASQKSPKRLRRSASSTSHEKMSSKVSQLLQKVQQSFVKNSDAKNAAGMKKYLRDQFDFLGIKTPVRRSISKEYLKVKFSPTEMREFVKLLWELPEREYQLFGLDYLDKNVKVFGESSEELEINFEFIEHLVTRKSWWDTVDAIASHLASFLVKKHPGEGKPVMEEWINHDNMWMRRTALLHQLLYKHETDEDMLYRFCILRADEKEFFIQKAMGWALRQYAHTKPSSVKSFLIANKKLLSKLTYREAAKHLDI